MEDKSHTNYYLPVLILYYITIILFFVFSFYPEMRGWGVNHWAYLPHNISYILFGLGIICPALISKVVGIIDINKPGMSYLFISGYIVILYSLIFILFKSNSHFLGDGYQNLAILSEMNPVAKFTEIGEALAHEIVKNLFGSGKDAALLSYQTISISAGIFFILFLVWASSELFCKLFDRLCFILGVSSGGYMLLYFGYVEHYSLFVLSVAVFCISGILIIKKKLNKWVSVVIVAVSIFLHILGVTLILPMIFLLVHDTAIIRKYRKSALSIRSLILLMSIVSAVSIFIYFYQTSYFFKFSIIPVVSDFYTVEGYTLFSANHLLDFLNLIILLVPSILAFSFLILKLISVKDFKNNENTFLILSVLTFLGAVFIIDPKLGMPRDWDLFSFAGVPLMIFLFYFLIKNQERVKCYKQIIILLVTLNILSLSPKVLSIYFPETAIKHLENYILLDKNKNQNVHLTLINYYKEQNRFELAKTTRARLDSLYPSRSLNEQGLSLYMKKEYDKAVFYFNQAIELDPVNSGFLNNLALCYLGKEMLDTALTLLKVSEGLNANLFAYSNLGDCYYRKKDYDKAEKYWMKTLQIDSNSFNALKGLMEINIIFDDSTKAKKYFFKAGNHNQAPVNLIVELSEYYYSRQDKVKGFNAINRALEKGLDTVSYNQIINKYKN